MCMAFWNQGKLGEAQSEFRGLQAGPPYETIGRIYYARTLIYQGRFKEADEQLAAGIWKDHAANNKSPELLQRYLLARSAIQLEDRTLALQQLALIVHTGEPEAFQTTDLQRAGALYAQMGEVALARRVLTTLRELQSKHGNAFNKASFHLLAGEIALSERKYVPALEQFTASQAEYPFAVTHGGLARAYEKRGEWQRAAAEWQELLKGRGEIFQDEDPTEWVLAHLALARAYAHLGQAGAARAEYDTFLKIWDHGEDLPAIRDARREMQELGSVQSPSH